MSELLTAAQMRAIETAAIESGEVTGLELMERAGQGVVQAIFAEWRELGPGAGVTVLCGSGNNGGDGFVVARLLHSAGLRVRVLAVPTICRGPDAKTARQRWRAAGGKTRPLRYKYFRRGAPAYRGHMAEASKDYSDLYVDAVLGTGARAPFGGEVGETLAYMAGRHGDYGFFQPRTVSIDLPSGLDADSGEIPGHPRVDPFAGQQTTIPNARLTVAFDSPKIGHVLGHGLEVCGKVVVADIGLEPWRTMSGGQSCRNLKPARSRLSSIAIPAEPSHGHISSIWDIPDRRRQTGLDFGLPAAYLRKRAGHKYNYGHAFFLSGGSGHTGAARLAARAALRIGAGLVTLAAPSDAIPECAAHLTAVMLRKCDCADDFSALLADERLNALCLGPGMGRKIATRKMVSAALETKRAVVLDADALTSFSETPGALFEMLHDKVVLTPHDGEFARLFPDISARLKGPQLPAYPIAQGFDNPTEHLQAVLDWREKLELEQAPLYARTDAVRDAAARAGCTVLLKGMATAIGVPRLGVSVSLSAYERAAPWLATAGSGDVLAGFITGLLARGFGPMQAAQTATWLHVECALEFGPGLIAEDLSEQLPAVFRRLEL